MHFRFTYLIKCYLVPVLGPGTRQLQLSTQFQNGSAADDCFFATAVFSNLCIIMSRECQ